MSLFGLPIHVYVVDDISPRLRGKSITTFGVTYSRSITPTAYTQLQARDRGFDSHVRRSNFVFLDQT